jgi:hypothetical protein
MESELAAALTAKAQAESALQRLRVVSNNGTAARCPFNLAGDMRSHTNPPAAMEEFRELQLQYDTLAAEADLLRVQVRARAVRG